MTDGEDNSSHIDHRQAEGIAEKEGVAIFSLQTGTTKMSSAEAHCAVDLLKELSVHTGGQALQPKKLEDGVPLLLKAANEQWVLDVVPNRPTDHKVHALAIKNSDKGVQASSHA
jgi:hypothetical protein